MDDAKLQWGVTCDLIDRGGGGSKALGGNVDDDFVVKSHAIGLLGRSMVEQ